MQVAFSEPLPAANSDRWIEVMLPNVITGERIDGGDVRQLLMDQQLGGAPP